MAATSQSFSPDFDDTLKREIVCSGEKLQSVLEGKKKATVGQSTWNRVKFEYELERVLDKKGEGKDLLLHVHCNRDAPDPHWRCSFTATVQCELKSQSSGTSETVEKALSADRKNNTMVLPLLRIPSTGKPKSVRLNITIQMTAWSGIFAKLRQREDVDEETTLSDVTLIVKGTHIPVARATLSQHSPIFSQMFSDAAKKEFMIDDVAPESMEEFLELINLQEEEDIQDMVTRKSVEPMLVLAELYDCQTVKSIIQDYLLEGMEYEEEEEDEDLAVLGQLLLADRFRLSAVCSAIMKSLMDGDRLKDLREAPQYDQLSAEMKEAISEYTKKDSRKRLETKKDSRKRLETQRAALETLHDQLSALTDSPPPRGKATKRPTAAGRATAPAASSRSKKPKK